LKSNRKTSPTIFKTAAEIDGRRFGKILGRAADLANRESVPENLREHLVVENEIV
jgi:hypothetical protein